MKEKTAAMEMSVGTIVTIVLLMTVLVLGLIFVRLIFTGATENVESINKQLMNEINDLFADGDKKLVVGLGGQNSAKVKQGTTSFGVPFGFSPDNPQVWGVNKEGCKYNIEVDDDGIYCIDKGWANARNSIITGVSNVKFDEVDSSNGYALMKIDVPEDIPECTQRFRITVRCIGYSDETTTGYFDLDVIKKGLF